MNVTCINLYCMPCKAKHPMKVHVWAGISKNGPKAIYIFDGIMKQELFVDILVVTCTVSGRSQVDDGQ